MYRFQAGRPRLEPAFTAERQGRRRLGDLAPVLAVPVSPGNRRIQYWTFGGVSDERHREALARCSVAYDLTFIPDRAVGWECPKTHGHVHVSAFEGGAGYAELYEVLEGHAGFLVQDLQPGPMATFAALITARAGETVVIPPRLHHAVVNLGPGMLVVGDIVSRASLDEYGLLRAARGMAYYVGVDGRAVPNAAYAQVPPLARIEAADWSRAAPGPLYEMLIEHPADLEWLSETDRSGGWWEPPGSGRSRGLPGMRIRGSRGNA